MGSPPHTWRILVGNVIIGTIARDHLHIRGEYAMLRRRQLDSNRITSTYVENTPKKQLRRYQIRDHLHIRGEYDISVAVEDADKGSPPHTWRIHKKLSNAKFIARITSTYVENTLPRVQEIQSKQDHLHIRGEYVKANQICNDPTGSPPHTWRIPYDVLIAVDDLQDHLHIRGEYSKQIPL